MFVWTLIGGKVKKYDFIRNLGSEYENRYLLGDDKPGLFQRKPVKFKKGSLPSQNEVMVEEEFVKLLFSLNEKRYYKEYLRIKHDIK